MKLIVNVDKNWAIGKGGKLLFHLSRDMKFFKEHTTNAIVVMGRKTLDSLPGGKPLPDRKTVTVFALLIVVHSLADQRGVRIDSRKDKIGRGRLEGRSVPRLHRHTGKMGQVRIPGSVDKNRSGKSLCAVFILYEDVGD